MNMTVEGLRPYDFEDEKSHERITGVTFFCAFKEEKIQGVGCKSFSVSMKKLGDYKPKIGDNVEPLYNEYGKVAGVRVL